jgi:hypothetical protein
LGLNPVSIEPCHKSTSFGDIPRAIDQELNIFEGILFPEGLSATASTVCSCFLQNLSPYPSSRVMQELLRFARSHREPTKRKKRQEMLRNERNPKKGTHPANIAN